MANFKALEPIIDKIIHLSESTYYNPYTTFDWPESIDDGKLWMSKELLSVYDTEIMEEMSEEQLYELSKWESVNFYSINIHGIRELLIEMLHLVHRKGFEVPSKYFHYFIGEENEHMHFFSKFCVNYGRKIYSRKKVDFGMNEDSDIINFMIFIKLLVFEEIVDYYNQFMAQDESLHPINRQINKIHHQDESRHISFNRAMVRVLFKQLQEKYKEDKLNMIRSYVKEYFLWSISEFYNPTVYRDTGFENPIELRNRLIKHSNRVNFHKKVIQNLMTFLKRQEILTEDFL